MSRGCWSCRKRRLVDAANCLTLAKSPRSSRLHSQLPGRPLCPSSNLASSQLPAHARCTQHSGPLTFVLINVSWWNRTICLDWHALLLCAASFEAASRQGLSLYGMESSKGHKQVCQESGAFYTDLISCMPLSHGIPSPSALLSPPCLRTLDASEAY